MKTGIILTPHTEHYNRIKNLLEKSDFYYNIEGDGFYFDEAPGYLIALRDELAEFFGNEYGYYIKILK